jgi:hypothetical protein
MKWQGRWDSARQYNPFDVVTFAGSTWLATRGSLADSPEPSSPDWELIGDLAGLAGPTGAPGPAGQKGPPGPAGTASAYGLIDGTVDPPTFDAGRSHNILSAAGNGGGYCVLLDPSIDLTKVVAVASVFFDNGTVSPLVGGCAVAGVQGVQFDTYDAAGSSANRKFYFVVQP